MRNIFIDDREIKEPKLFQAAFSFLALIAVMSVGIIIFKVDPHIPMFVGVIIAAIVAMTLGYKWETIEKMMIDGIGKRCSPFLFWLLLE